jgi:Zn-dependent peptidase ImmA (M78 family)
MFSTSRRFRTLIKNWNKKQLTEADFYRICKKQGVVVLENDTAVMKWKGLYMMIEGVPTIIINAKLKGLERLWAMFHELGHHILHSPSTCFFSESTVHKTQSEANAFAACALIPEQYVRQMYLWNLCDVDEFSAKLFQIRLEIFETYKV